MKKYLITIILVLALINVKAQTTLPDSISKKIIIELIQKDSLSTEVWFLHTLRDIDQQKLVIKDSIINVYVNKDLNYNQEITNLNKINKKLLTKQKLLKVKGRVLGTSTSALFAILGIFIIIKN